MKKYIFLVAFVKFTSYINAQSIVVYNQDTVRSIFVSFDSIPFDASDTTVSEINRTARTTSAIRERILKSPYFIYESMTVGVYEANKTYAFCDGGTRWVQPHLVNGGLIISDLKTILLLHTKLSPYVEEVNSLSKEETFKKYGIISTHGVKVVKLKKPFVLKM